MRSSAATCGCLGSSVALLGVLGPSAATCSRLGSSVALLGVMRPSAATFSRISSSVALLGECERAGSKRDSDCEAQSLHGDHFVFSYQIDEAKTPGAGVGFPPSPP
jgi:hypothetical protein